MRVLRALSLIAMALPSIAFPAYGQTQEELGEQAFEYCDPVFPASQVEDAFDLMLFLLVGVPPDKGVQSCMWQLSQARPPTGVVVLHVQYNAETFKSSYEARKAFEDACKAN